MVIMADDLKNDLSVPKLQEFLKSILSSTSKTTKLVNQLEEIIIYKDVNFFTWKLLFKILSTDKNNDEVFMLNALGLMEKIVPSKSFTGEEERKGEESLVFGIKNGSKKFMIDVPLLKKYMRKVWESLINREMSPLVHRKLLLLLLESYLSRLDKAIFLTDFLMASLNVKGVISILALQGMATLMQKHNIEYPNIYGKLYSFFEPDVFQTKFKCRLFYLADIFLSSTHLPEVLVASFVKRVSRLGLLCAAPDILIILRFVENLFLRHTGLKKMIHHPLPDHEVPEDPFVMEESDPMKTRASESSLWEISLLKRHCLPSVSSAARFIDSPLPSLEKDLGEVLNNSYKDMFDSESKRKKQKTSLTFERPQQTIERLKDDRLFKLWSLAK